MALWIGQHDLARDSERMLAPKLRLCNHGLSSTAILSIPLCAGPMSQQDVDMCLRAGLAVGRVRSTAA